MERNRIISGLSDATVVTEAPKESGALSTARHACKQGKPLFVFAQLFDSIQNEGGKNLDANVVSSADDVITMLKNKTMEKRFSENIFLDERISQ